MCKGNTIVAESGRIGPPKLRAMEDLGWQGRFGSGDEQVSCRRTCDPFRDQDSSQAFETKRRNSILMDFARVKHH